MTDFFCSSAFYDIVVLVRLDLHIRDEGEYEFDQLIHAAFSPLLQLEKALKAYQFLVYFGTYLDTSVEASFLFGRR